MIRQPAPARATQVGRTHCAPTRPERATHHSFSFGDLHARTLNGGGDTLTGGCRDILTAKSNSRGEVGQSWRCASSAGRAAPEIMVYPPIWSMPGMWKSTHWPPSNEKSQPLSAASASSLGLRSALPWQSGVGPNTLEPTRTRTSRTCSTRRRRQLSHAPLWADPGSMRRHQGALIRRTPDQCVVLLAGGVWRM